VETFNFNPEVFMDRHFLIPAMIAAALHAGVLFGIRPEKIKAAAPADTPPLIQLVKNVVEFVLEPPPSADAEASAVQRSADAAPPALPERPVDHALRDFLIPVPASPVNPSKVPATTIPLGPFGPPSDLPRGPGIEGGGAVNFAALDRTPRTRSQTPPVYPFEAKRGGVSGSVTVEFMVNESGGVVGPRVVESTDAIFNDAALRAVARWRFEPGRKDGRIVSFRMAVPVVFSISAE